MTKYLRQYVYAKELSWYFFVFPNAKSLCTNSQHKGHLTEINSFIYKERFVMFSSGL